MEDKEEIIINERYRSIVITKSVKAGDTGHIIIIKAPKGYRIEIIGTNDVKNKIDAGRLIVRIANKDGNTIDLDTEIVITHERSDGINQITKLCYHDISTVKEINAYEDINLTKKIIVYRPKTELELCRFKNTIILDEEERFIISVINAKQDIEKIKITLNAMIKNK